MPFPIRSPSFYPKISNQLYEHEGFIPHVYRDSLGIWTIGIGKMVDQRKGGGITLEQALRLLEDEIREKEADLDRLFPWWRELSEVRQRVILDMAFNLGIVGLSGFNQTLTAMKLGHYAVAAGGMRRSLWAKQVGERAERLAKMMETGEEIKKWW